MLLTSCSTHPFPHGFLPPLRRTLAHVLPQALTTHDNTKGSDTQRSPVGGSSLLRSSVASCLSASKSDTRMQRWSLPATAYSETYWPPSYKKHGPALAPVARPRVARNLISAPSTRGRLSRTSAREHDSSTDRRTLRLEHRSAR